MEYDSGPENFKADRKYTPFHKRIILANIHKNIRIFRFFADDLFPETEKTEIMDENLTNKKAPAGMVFVFFALRNQ